MKPELWVLLFEDEVEFGHELFDPHLGGIQCFTEIVTNFAHELCEAEEGISFSMCLETFIRIICKDVINGTENLER